MKSPRSFIGSTALWLGIVWPLLTLVFELSTRACAGTFFDPLPTGWHVLAILPVPLACLAVWWVRKKGDAAGSGGAAFLVRAAWPPMLLYGLVFLPLTVTAMIFLPMTLPFLVRGHDPEARFIFALVLAALGPVMGFIGLSAANGSLSRLQSAAPPDLRPKFVRWRRRGWRAGWALLLVAELPLVWTHAWLDLAGRNTSRARVLALEVLRASGDGTLLLRAAYEGRPTQAFGPSVALVTTVRGMFFQKWAGSGAVSQTASREIFYRVTGRPFNDLPPPRRNQTRLLGRDEAREDDSLDGFAWDDERGGDKVGARLKGLSLMSSEMTWHADKDSALAQGEWTLEFTNRHGNAQEARCQILLPPGACVSRLNLWLPGQEKPQEAAFGAREQVKAAYTKVVVVERRDPVMVNMVGPDRVMTQCFPVPPGGAMKIRLGITAPCDESTGGKLHFPAFLERNFSVPEALTHAVTLRSNGPFSVVKGGTVESSSEDPQTPWKARLTTRELELSHLQMKAPSALSVWARDPFVTGNEPPYLLRSREPVRTTPARRVVVVVDASESLRPHADAIREALLALPATLPLTVVLSTDDEPQTMTREELKAKLRARAFRGGRDSLPALTLALRRCQEAGEPAALFWLHGPQPWNFLAPEESAAEATSRTVSRFSPSLEAVEQQLKQAGRQPLRPVFHTLSLHPGTNRLLESLYRTGSFLSGQRWDGTPSGLGAFLSANCTGHESWRHVSRRLAEAPQGAVQVWDQLVRHDVFDQVMTQFLGSSADPEAAGRLATRYQLVTPFSGAVVLETREQFDAAGLQPVDPNAAPVMPSGVPEPSRTLLAVLALAAWLLQRRRGTG